MSSSAQFRLSVRQRDMNKARRSPTYSELRRLFRRAKIPRTSRDALKNASLLVQRVTQALIDTCVDISLGADRKTLTTRCLNKAIDAMRDNNKHPVHLVSLAYQENVKRAAKKYKAAASSSSSSSSSQ
jgi:histone H3/H4